MPKGGPGWICDSHRFVPPIHRGPRAIVKPQSGGNRRRLAVGLRGAEGQMAGIFANFVYL